VTPWSPLPACPSRPWHAHPREPLLKSNPTCNIGTKPPSITTAGLTSSVPRKEAPVFLAFIGPGWVTRNVRFCRSWRLPCRCWRMLRHDYLALAV
jgi:hypothetical protein